ncbi:glycoside hydrolase family 16 protein [Gelidibacter salicanalis]|uniref:Glycoside hydrolase family 16 protein n=1 Tax=Gelidibacter salicanalis TaxID=291193 RepID=A0A934KXH5_9FLAO|nr:glycoside hydrolase family 16 protein [Gelidibacter salicanalis]MBJ7881110.1 glycoside hydrolase family 16 protein [Gelidibacter salicanalis]
MKNFKTICFYFMALTAFAVVSCQEDDVSIGDIIAPSDLQVQAEIVGKDTDNPFGDGSGVVKFSASAKNALTFKFVTPESQQLAPNGVASIPFTSANSGIFTYQVAVVAYGTGGISTSTTIDVEVFVDYTPPADLLQKLFGDGSKTWRIKSEKAGHFGLGPVGGNIPAEWYGAGPEEKAGVGMYDDRYIFNSDGTFTHITNNNNDDPTTDASGTVFGRKGLIDELNGPGGTADGDDIFNYPYNDYTNNYQISAPGGAETITLSGTGFIGYYTGGSHQYRIFDRSVPNELILTTADGNGSFNWWFIITSEEPATAMDEFTTIFNTLIWEDNFNTNGAPNPANWTYDLGTGSNGWGNNESQSYTDSPSNIIVEDGSLKITAKAENGNYTSSRIKTENLFEFTYGRVEVRAKLPKGAGTWPAIWMLGANYDTNAWPASGEIDIMEHVGNDQNTIHSTLHFPGNSGGNGVTESTTVATASTEFHIYSVEWTADFIKFLVDDTVYHTFPNTAAKPFNADFFLILNVAMGGNFGGTIDPAFTASTLEIDYVKVFQ